MHPCNRMFITGCWGGVISLSYCSGCTLAYTRHRSKNSIPVYSSYIPLYNITITHAHALVVCFPCIVENHQRAADSWSAFMSIRYIRKMAAGSATSASKYLVIDIPAENACANCDPPLHRKYQFLKQTAQRKLSVAGKSANRNLNIIPQILYTNGFKSFSQIWYRTINISFINGIIMTITTSRNEVSTARTFWVH